MSFTAINTKGSHIPAKSASKSEGWAYKCPSCGREMKVAGGNGTAVRKHFRHRPGDTCGAYSGVDEGAAHAETKDSITTALCGSSWASSISEETSVGNTVADILCEIDGQRVGVEVQVSGISAQDLRKRTRKRSGEGAYTLWLFHEDTYGRTKTSKNGNTYVTFRGGELGYQSLTRQGDTEGTWIHYVGSEGRMTARYIKLFEDGGGGWIDRRVPFDRPSLFCTSSGFKLAASTQAIPANTGDENQMRLF